MAAIDPTIGALRILDPFNLGITHLGDDLRQGREQRVLVRAGRAGRVEAFDELDVSARHPASSIPPGTAFSELQTVSYPIRCPDGYRIEIVEQPTAAQTVQGASAGTAAPTCAYTATSKASAASTILASKNGSTWVMITPPTPAARSIQ